MLVNMLREQLTVAMKTGDTIKKGCIRVILGEVDRGTDSSDKRVTAIIRKLVESNAETLKYAQQKHVLQEEIKFMHSLLPQVMSLEQVIAALAQVAVQVKDSNSEGAAMGVAMKFLKGSGANVDSATVKEAVQLLRK
jgi:uncharacterized protein